MNIEGNTFFSETSKGANKNSMGQIRNIQSKPIKALSKKDKGKVARVLADKISICSKVDYFKGEPIGETLKLELEQKYQ